MIYKRHKIVYLPYPIRGNKINDYTLNMVKILKEKYMVSGNLAEPMDALQILNTKAVFLNWVEESLDTKMKWQLRLYRLLGAKVVWVFHNKYPHDIAVNHKVIDNMKWLADNSNVIVLHSKSSLEFLPNADKNAKKVTFVPLVMYENQNANCFLGNMREKYHIAENDFVFTMFGLIRPYKKFELGIEAFKNLNLPHAKLLIAGNPINGEYSRSIEKLCEDNENIILDLRYLSDKALNDIINVSDVIVLPYSDTSSMNSSVMIQAFGNGKTVIAPDICMAKDLAKYKFFYRYRQSLQNVMLKAYRNGKEENRDMGKRAKQYIEKNNNKNVVANAIFSFLK